MFINAHTHNIDSDADISVISMHADKINIAFSDKIKYTCGIHPWFVDETKTDVWLSKIEKLCKNNEIVAIGECGLDKTKENLVLQQEIFEKQILLSEQYKLPLIIHSVRTHHLILEARKATKAKMPWMIHGYSGSPEMMHQFTKQNIYLSFNNGILKQTNKLKELLSQIDTDFMLIETDDSDISIYTIYNEIANMLGVNISNIEKIIENNFKKLYK